MTGTWWLTEGQPRLIGTVHLGPLPGSPRWNGSVEEVEQSALRDAEAFARGGADAVLVENFGDVPFQRGPVEPWVVATMATVVSKVAARVPIPVGVNVLRNDARAALGVCVAARAGFIRVNVLCGVLVTDQGLVEGSADALMRARRSLGAQVKVLADFRVKHAAPLVKRQLQWEVSELVQRGLADAVIVTGPATGTPPEPEEVTHVAMTAGETPVLVGSGVAPQNLPGFLPYVRGVIVGSWVKIDGRVDAERVRQLADILHRA